MSRLFSYHTAALFLAISAGLHFIAPLVGGISQLTQLLLGAGILYLLLAWAMKRNMRWLAYFIFIILLIGFVISLGFSFGGSSVPGWLFACIAIADFIAAVALFGSLWRSKSALT